MRVVASVFLLIVTLNATPLNRAIKDVNLQKIRELLKECKDINLQDVYGDTPLHAAAKVGRLSVIKAVLRCEPDADIKNRRGNTPLSIAIAKNQIRAVNMILDYKKRVSTSKKKSSAVYSMIEQDDLNSFKELLQQGVDVNTKDKNGVTFLHVAAKKRAKKIVKFLLENGADSKVKDKEYRDALYYAILGRDKEIIEMIRKDLNGQK